MSKAKCRIRSGDTVVVVAGKDKNRRGRVLKVFPEARKVIVEGVNQVKRHVKPTGDRQGGIMTKEAPIHISNVAFWLGDSEGHRVKVGYQTLEDGSKVRIDRSTGARLDNASKEA